MTRRKMTFGTGLGFVALGLAALTGGYAVWADENEDEHRDALIMLVSAVKVSLQQGLTASEQEGQPISGKFKIEEDKFRLSVYTAKGGKYFEVLIDHTTGKVAKVEPIKGAYHLAAAELQSATMARAKIPLKEAVDKALREAADFRAVSVAPDVKDSHAVATIVLVRGKQFKTVQEQLD